MNLEKRGWKLTFQAATKKDLERYVEFKKKCKIDMPGTLYLVSFTKRIKNMYSLNSHINKIHKMFYQHKDSLKKFFLTKTLQVKIIHMAFNSKSKLQEAKDIH